MEIRAQTVVSIGEPMQAKARNEIPEPGEVLVQVAGCGVCHTDLSFYYEGVPTRHPLPLTLGHEVSGTVVATGEGSETWLGRAVIVPAVIPCGECSACVDDKSSICPDQVFPGNDIHGGFASHLRVPARGLCSVPDLTDPTVNPGGLDLATLSVVADAVTTPYQAILRSGLTEGDLAIFVGVGGVGGFGIQIAAALGAHPVALDVNTERLESAREYGAELALSPAEMGFRAIRKAVREFAASHDVPTWRRRVFETSGTTRGQATAFGLLEPGGYLSVVGFTPEKVELRLSNLMAFDATVQGNWGCRPEHYPAVLDLVLSMRVVLEPLVVRKPLDEINDVFSELHSQPSRRRVILVPERTQT